ncbi:MAG: T9SS type A sorting domain-containing protein, partial [bacterium]
HDPVTANIFPNPAKDKVTIMWDKKNEPVEIVMSDALGRIISHLSVPNGENSVELSLSSFEPGVYIIKVGNHALRMLKL